MAARSEAPGRASGRLPPGSAGGRLPPGPAGLPLAGNALAFGRDKLGFLMRCYQQYGRSFTVRVFGVPAVFLIGPEANRLILGEQAPKFLWRPAFANLIPLLGEGLLVTDGELHARQRRLVLPAFQRRRVEGYTPLMWEYARRYFARWRPGQPVEIDAAMRQLTLQIAGRTLFGMDTPDGFTALSHQFERMIAYSDTRRPFDLLKVNLPFTPWGRFVRARRQLDRFVYQMIRARLGSAPPTSPNSGGEPATGAPAAGAGAAWGVVPGVPGEWRSQYPAPHPAGGSAPTPSPGVQGRSPGGGGGGCPPSCPSSFSSQDWEAGGADDVLTALVSARDEDGSRLSARQVRDQIVMLLAAGHETTAHALTWTLYLLARHPAALERVLAEQQAVLGGRPPEASTLGELRYLEMVLKETLRLYPPAWAGPRVTAEEIDFEGYRIPAGTYVVYCQWLSHRLPEVFPGPEAFRPERFDPERGDPLPPYAYVPFGGGARLCLGMAFALQEMKIVLSALLAAWHLDLVPGQRIVPVPAVTLLPRHGIYLRPRLP